MYNKVIYNKSSYLFEQEINGISEYSLDRHFICVNSSTTKFSFCSLGGILTVA